MRGRSRPRPSSRPAVGLRAPHWDESAADPPARAVPVVRVQAGRVRSAGGDRVAVRRRDHHPRRLRRPERPRRERPDLWWASATRSRRTAWCSSSCSAAPPGPARRAARPDRLQSDIVARRDYSTPRPSSSACSTAARSPARPLRRLRRRVSTPTSPSCRRTPSMQPLRVRRCSAAQDGPVDPLDSASVGVQLARTIPKDDGRELENWAGAGARSEALQVLPAAARAGQVATIPASAGRFPSTPGRTREDERIGFKRSSRFLKGVKAPKARPRLDRVDPRRLGRVGDPRQRQRSWLFHGPQLGFEIPEQLAEFEVHRPGLDARGVTPPGLPLVGIGRNDHIAWGLTSGTSDDDDLYVERLAGKERYRYKGRVRKMKCRTETFKVSGQSDVKRRLCRTLHGPVQARAGKRPRSPASTRSGTTRWTPSRARAAQRGRPVRGAAKAIAKVTWNENTMVADDQGNIGWFHPGRLPTAQALGRAAAVPRHRQRRVAGHPEGLPAAARDQPQQGWLANWNNAPSVGWTIGDAPDQDRNAGVCTATATCAGWSAMRRGRRATTPSRASTASPVRRAAAPAARLPCALPPPARPAGEGAARRRRGVGRLLRPDRRRRHGRPGRRPPGRRSRTRR